MAKHSVYVIDSNDEPNMRACLESVADWSEELIVVDSHSTNRTAAISLEFTMRCIIVTSTDLDDCATRLAHSRPISGVSVRITIRGRRSSCRKRFGWCSTADRRRMPTSYYRKTISWIGGSNIAGGIPIIGNHTLPLECLRTVSSEQVLAAARAQRSLRMVPR